MSITKLKLVVPNEESYVRMLSGLVPGGLTKKEMAIVILLMKLQDRMDTKELSQEMKEKVRIHLDISSQTMHNYWNKLKQKKVIIGNYHTYKFNTMFRKGVELNISYPV